MSTTLYIQTDKNVEVHQAKVCLQDIAQLSCSNAHVLNRYRAMPVVNLSSCDPGRYVLTIADLISQIQKNDATMEVTHMGEPTFILTYEVEKHAHKWFRYLKAALVCLITFFGTGFSIMTFNNDVNVGKLFDQLYVQFTGEASPEFSILHMTYSIGIGVGVLFFFNYFGKMKFTQDPTPMQVQMRQYEDQVDTTLMEDAGRKEKQTCGSRH